MIFLGLFVYREHQFAKHIMGNTRMNAKKKTQFMHMIGKSVGVKIQSHIYGSYLLFWPVKRFEYIFCGTN